MTEITGVRADIITALIGDVAPATDSLVKQLAESVQKRRDHEHPTHEDWFCINQVSWAGKRAAYLLRRLLDSEDQLAESRAKLARLTEQSQLWHRGELDTTTTVAGIHAELDGTPLPPVGQWDRDQRNMPASALTYFELRRGTPDDPMPLVLGQYTTLDLATAHGADSFQDAFGRTDQLTWYPADDSETIHHLYATDAFGEEIETEWHVVTRTIAAEYDPNAEG